MKFLLVLALVAAASAEEAAKPTVAATPLIYGAAWNNWAYNYPAVYNAAPYYNNFYPYAAYPQVQIKPVEKEVEYTVKKIEFVAPEGACKNIFGAPVPCNKAKRSADDEEMKPEEEEKKIVPFTYGYGLPYAYNYPTVYSQYYNQYPLAYNYPAYTTASVAYTAPSVAYSAPLAYSSPVVYHTRVARSADDEEMKPEEEKKIVPFTYGYGLPYAYNYPTVYNQYPLAYNYPAYTTAPVAYTVPKPIVKEVEYIKPVVKTVVEKVPLVPACKNAWGFNVPCAHNE